MQVSDEQEKPIQNCAVNKMQKHLDLLVVTNFASL